MKEKNINRTKLAKDIGIAPSTVNSWFSRNCNNITLSTLIKLSKYFDLTIEELVHGEPSPSVNFNEYEFSDNELKILKKFSNFLRDNINEKEA